MASLKSLMQAKKASTTSQRITAPFADYSRRTNALSCSLCQLPVKHESLWGAHTQSKGHRVAVQRFEAEQQQAAAQAKKRKLDSPDDAPSKRARDDDPPQEGALPAGFFANPSEAPAPRAPSPAPAPVAAAAAGGGSGATTTAAAAAADDPDWAAFEAFLADDSTPAPLPGSSSSAPAPATGRKTASATIRAQPVRFEFGAPVVAAEGEEVPEGGEEEEEEKEQETEEEKAEREAREEREEMMARLEEEEREQKEADEKVTVLKRRLEAIRAARQKKAAPAS
ncbi:uncharacterized protein JCM10292_003459 [Rhodotorula paludigena]|uniref:uncharacterized protein n=1 Tax=Rhodotorula paludigena TaxID=86838 RepID=UPI00317A16AD